MHFTRSSRNNPWYWLRFLYNRQTLWAFLMLLSFMPFQLFSITATRCKVFNLKVVAQCLAAGWGGWLFTCFVCWPYQTSQRKCPLASHTPLLHLHVPLAHALLHFLKNDQFLIAGAICRLLLTIVVKSGWNLVKLVWRVFHYWCGEKWRADDGLPKCWVCPEPSLLLNSEKNVMRITISSNLWFQWVEFQSVGEILLHYNSNESYFSVVLLITPLWYCLLCRTRWF